jgi:hypothetical protein
MWLKIQEINPVWYIDATGSVLKNLRNQIMPFLYSIVCHDPMTKSIIPIAEFISCCHSTLWISNNMFAIKTMLNHNITAQKKYVFAPIIVTDFSWALINSILLVFNNCSVVQYIKWTFDLLTTTKREKSSILKNMLLIRHYLCSTHFLRIIIKRSKQIKCDDKLIKTFIFAFSLIQNTTNLKQFEENLKDIFHVFNQPTQNNVFMHSMMRIRTQLSNREQTITSSEDPKYCIRDQDQEALLHENFIFSKDFEKNIKKNSPYVNHFEGILKSSKEIIPLSGDEPVNSFFKPELFQIIQDYLYIAPLWSGIIIGAWQIQTYGEVRFTRLTNNPVENWFGHLKNNLIYKNSMPSELCGSIYEKLQVKYFLYYAEPENIDKKPAKLDIKIEKWKKLKMYKREKGFYYNNFTDFGKLDVAFENESICESKIDFDDFVNDKGSFF